MNKNALLDYNIEIEKEARQLWRDIAIAYTSSDNSTDVKAGEKWANHLSKAYLDRYTIESVFIAGGETRERQGSEFKNPLKP